MGQAGVFGRGSAIAVKIRDSGWKTKALRKIVQTFKKKEKFDEI
jgi:hypothetical protein